MLGECRLLLVTRSSSSSIVSGALETNVSHVCQAYPTTLGKRVPEEGCSHCDKTGSWVNQALNSAVIPGSCSLCGILRAYFLCLQMSLSGLCKPWFVISLSHLGACQP